MVQERSTLMQPPPKKSLTKSAWSAYLCICVALLLLLSLGVWSAYRDVRYLRTTLLQAEVSRLRSHAARTVGRIERDLEQRAEFTGLEDVDREGWLRRHWAEFIPRQGEQLYAAIIDGQHTIVHHSDPQPEWAAARTAVVRTRRSRRGGGCRANPKSRIGCRRACVRRASSHHREPSSGWRLPRWI